MTGTNVVHIQTIKGNWRTFKTYWKMVKYKGGKIKMKNLNVRGQLGNYKIPSQFEWMLNLDLKTLWMLSEEVEKVLKRYDLEEHLTDLELKQMNELDDVLTDVCYYYEEDENNEGN